MDSNNSAAESQSVVGNSSVEQGEKSSASVSSSRERLLVKNLVAGHGLRLINGAKLLREAIGERFGIDIHLDKVLRESETSSSDLHRRARAADLMCMEVLRLLRLLYTKLTRGRGQLEGRFGSPRVADYHTSTVWPRVVMHKLDLSEWDNARTTSDSSAVEITHTRRCKRGFRNRKTRNSQATRQTGNVALTMTLRSRVSKNRIQNQSSTELLRSPSPNASPAPKRPVGRPKGSKPRSLGNSSKRTQSSSGKSVPQTGRSTEELGYHRYNKRRRVTQRGSNVNNSNSAGEASDHREVVTRQTRSRKKPTKSKGSKKRDQRGQTETMPGLVRRQVENKRKKPPRSQSKRTKKGNRQTEVPKRRYPRRQRKPVEKELGNQPGRRRRSEFVDKTSEEPKEKGPSSNLEANEEGNQNTFSRTSRVGVSSSSSQVAQTPQDLPNVEHQDYSQAEREEEFESGLDVEFINENQSGWNDTDPEDYQNTQVYLLTTTESGDGFYHASLSNITADTVLNPPTMAEPEDGNHASEGEDWNPEDVESETRQDNSNVLFKCCVGDCDFATNLYNLLQRHITVDHNTVFWNGVCNGYESQGSWSSLLTTPHKNVSSHVNQTRNLCSASSIGHRDLNIGVLDSHEMEGSNALQKTENNGSSPCFLQQGASTLYYLVNSEAGQGASTVEREEASSSNEKCSNNGENLMHVDEDVPTANVEGQEGDSNFNEVSSTMESQICESELQNSANEVFSNGDQNFFFGAQNAQNTNLEINGCNTEYNESAMKSQFSESDSNVVQIQVNEYPSCPTILTTVVTNESQPLALGTLGPPAPMTLTVPCETQAPVWNTTNFMSVPILLQPSVIGWQYPVQTLQPQIPNEWNSYPMYVNRPVQMFEPQISSNEVDSSSDGNVMVGAQNAQDVNTEVQGFNESAMKSQISESVTNSAEIQARKCLSCPPAFATIEPNDSPPSLTLAVPSGSKTPPRDGFGCPPILTPSVLLGSSVPFISKPGLAVKPLEPQNSVSDNVNLVPISTRSDPPVSQTPAMDISNNVQSSGSQTRVQNSNDSVSVFTQYDSPASQSTISSTFDITASKFQPSISTSTSASAPLFFQPSGSQTSNKDPVKSICTSTQYDPPASQPPLKITAYEPQPSTSTALSFQPPAPQTSVKDSTNSVSVFTQYDPLAFQTPTAGFFSSSTYEPQPSTSAYQPSGSQIDEPRGQPNAVTASTFTESRSDTVSPIPSTSLLNVILDRTKEEQCTIPPEKQELIKLKMRSPWHESSRLGVRPNIKKLQLIREFSLPENYNELRQFIKLVSYCRKFVKNYTVIVNPLLILSERKDEPFPWTDIEQKSFDELKGIFMADPFLHFPNFNKEFILTAESCNFALSCVLSQGDIENGRVIGYGSRKLNTYEEECSVTEKELSAIVFGVDHFKVFLENQNFTIVTTHEPLTWMITSQDLGSKMASLRDTLLQYNFKLVYCNKKRSSGSSGSSGASEASGASGSTPLAPWCFEKSKNLPKRLRSVPNFFKFHYSLTDVPTATTIRSSQRSHTPLVLFYSKDLSNNNPLSRYIRTQFDFYNIRKPSGLYEVIELENETQTIYLCICRNSYFDQIQYADLILCLAKLHDYLVDKEYTGRVYIHDITKTNKNIEKKIFSEMIFFTFKESEMEGILLTLKRERLSEEEKWKVMEKYHTDTISNAHFSFRNTYARIKEKFKWNRMKNDVYFYVKNCHECNGKGHCVFKYTKLAFKEVCVNLLGPFRPTKKGNAYVMTVQDLRTEYSYAVAIKNRDLQTIAAEFRGFITRFNTPKVICSEQGIEFTNRLIEILIQDNGLEYLQSRPCPDSNSSLIVSHFFKTFINNYHGEEWDLILTYAMYVLNNSRSFGYYTPTERLYDGKGGMEVHNLLMNNTVVSVEI